MNLNFKTFEKRKTKTFFFRNVNGTSEKWTFVQRRKRKKNPVDEIVNTVNVMTTDNMTSMKRKNIFSKVIINLRRSTEWKKSFSFDKRQKLIWN